MKNPPRIAISLGASFMGYATHAGFMARLHALGVRPVAMAGSSAGALTAGLYAAGLETEAIRQAVLSPRLYLSFASRTKWVWHQFVEVFRHLHPGFLNPIGAIGHFESLVGQRGIESLTQPRLMIAMICRVTRPSSPPRGLSPVRWRSVAACRCFFHRWSSTVVTAQTAASLMRCLSIHG
jgi:predicted acylesterase/phospholipase RssA